MMTKRRGYILAFLFALALGVAMKNCMAADRYVSPAVFSGGTGTLIDPWPLATAAASSNNTVYLRGGTYTGVWSVTGTNNTFRSYQGEWAVLDIYYRPTLNGAITNSQTTVTLNGSFVFYPGVDFFVENELIHILSGTHPTYNVVRGWGGTTAVSHASGIAILLNVNGLNINGAGNTIRDFELKNSNPVRAYPGQSGSDLRYGTGIDVQADDTTIIQMVVHDLVNAIGKSATVQRLNVYGCIVFNNGYVADDRTHGHGLYLQNSASGYTTVRESISVNEYTTGMKLYGVTGEASRFKVEGYIGANNGSPGHYTGNPTGLPGTYRWSNMEVGGDSNPSADIEIKNAYLYHQPNTLVQIPGLSVGRYSSGGNTSLVLQNSYVAEAANTANIDQWIGATLTGNTFYQTDANDGLVMWAKNITGTVNWNNNTYVAPSAIRNCAGGNKRAPFYRDGTTGPCGAFLDFAEWKAATGFDANSTYSETALNTTVTFVRAVNAYQACRQHIVVYNWAGLSSVNVNFTGCTTGQGYEIRKAENYLGTPIVTGTYTGAAVSIPLTDTTVATPIGSSFTPSSTLPVFGAFVVVPTGCGTAVRHFFSAPPCG